MSKQKLPKGFFTKGGEPTMNALTAYVVYYNNGGTVVDQTLKPSALQSVKDYFNIPGGYEAILTWGLSDSCLKAKQSYGQARAMRSAANMAWTLKNTFLI